MQLTRFTDIGLRIVMLMATSPDMSSTSKELAAALAVPYTHVAKVIMRLSELGIVHSRRGRNGGLVITELGRDARVGWLAARLEGDGEVVDCDGATPCPLRHGCRLRDALAQAHSAFFAALDEHTVNDLVTDSTGAVLLTLALPSRQAQTPGRRPHTH